MNLLRAMILFCFAVSCQAGDARIEVSVAGLADDVRSLEVAAYLMDQPALGLAHTVARDLDHFVVSLPEAPTGDLRLEIAGLGADRCQLAGGTVHLSIAGPGHYQVPIQLARTGAGCTLVVRKVGKGAGAVMLPNGMSCGDRCEVRGQRDGQLQLGRTVAGFAGWYGACLGHGQGCVVTIPAGRVEVVADFIDRQALGCSDAGWCREEVPAPVGASLFALWGSGSGAIWAIGNGGMILHGDGISWSVQRNAGLPLNAISGTGPADVWAVGDRGTILHWDGSAWSDVPSGIAGDLHALWSRGADDVWAAGGQGAMLHWDGSAWSPATSGSQVAFRALWGSASDDVWAVGDGGTALHWDGAKWTATATGTTSNLHGIWGDFPGDVWAVGDQGTVVQWRGRDWRLFPSGVQVRLNAVWSSPSAGTYAVGDSATLLRLDGLSWDPQALPMGTTASLRATWGAGAQDIWTAGDSGTLLRYRP